MCLQTHMVLEGHALCKAEISGCLAPARLFDAVFAAAEYFRKMQKFFHSFGDTSAGEQCLFQVSKPHQVRVLGDSVFLMKMFSIA